MYYTQALEIEDPYMMERQQKNNCQIDVQEAVLQCCVVSGGFHPAFVDLLSLRHSVIHYLGTKPSAVRNLMRTLPNPEIWWERATLPALHI